MANPVPQPVTHRHRPVFIYSITMNRHRSILLSAISFPVTQGVKVKTVLLLTLLTLLTCQSAFSQSSDTATTQPVLSFAAVVDAFYAYDFNKPVAGFRQPFLYNHNRHNEFNLNLGLIRASVLHSKYRAAISLQAGTYAMDNYAAEQPLLQHVFEAFAGMSLNPQNTLWLDAGIFGSHIGFESAITSENWTPTRSLLAENSPYFLTGAKISYSPSPEWLLTFVVNNGWQRIQRVAGNSLPGFGTQLNYSTGELLTLNWSTFIGTDDPDPIRRMRYFNNLYGQFMLTEKWGLIAGLDTGIQQKAPNSTEYALWYSPVLISRYAFNQNWAAALRAEYYSDEYGVIVDPINSHGFKTAGFSANLDYSPAPQVMWRIESRWLSSPREIFIDDATFGQNNLLITSTLTVAFGD